MSNPLTTPVQIDTEIARLLGEQQKPQRVVNMHLDYLATKGATGFLADKSHYYTESEHKAAQAQVDALQVKIDALQDKYTGWPRYYHVTNVNGHVHTSMYCSSCFSDTQFSWRTDLSGLTPEQVVAQEAYNACSVCMPIAPVEQKAARKRYNDEQRAARKAEKDTKANDKLAKAAVRAQKLITKVEAAYEALGGKERVLALPDFATFGRVVGYELPQTVHDVIYDDFKVAQGERRWNKDPYQTVADAREKGLIA